MQYFWKDLQKKATAIHLWGMWTATFYILSQRNKSAHWQYRKTSLTNVFPQKAELPRKTSFTMSFQTAASQQMLVGSVLREFKATLPHERFNSDSSRKMPASFLCAATSFSSVQVLLETSFVLFKQRVSRQRTKRWWAERHYRCQNSNQPPVDFCSTCLMCKTWQKVVFNDLHPNQTLFFSQLCCMLCCK